MSRNAEDIKRLVDGRWIQILKSVCGLSDQQLNPKIHGPCPKCGGTDRYRALDDVAVTGALFCNQCHFEKNSDGFASIQWLRNCTFSEAVRLAADEIENGDNGHPNQASQPKSKSIHATLKKAASAIAWGMVQGGILTEQRKPDAVWRYRNADDSDCGAILRWDLSDDKKEIRQVSRIADGWISSAMPQPRPLFRLPEIIAADEIWVVEGEKSVDAAVSLGLHATCSAGGSGAAEKTDWSPLDGKQVVILPDNDEAGIKYAEDVIRLICKQAPSAIIEVKQLREIWPEIPEGGDIADWSAHFDGSDSESLQTRLRSIPNSLTEFVGDSFKKPSANKAFADKANEFIPFPVDELPPVLAKFCMEVAATVGCDSSFPALACLTVCAAAIGTSRQLCVKYGWFVPPIIWAILVGESGTQKSPPFRMATTPLKERQKRDVSAFAAVNSQYLTDLKAYKRDHKLWEKTREGEEPQQPDRPLRRRCVVQDSTIEALAPILKENPRGVLLARDELSGWLAGFDKYSNKASASSEVPKWLEIYNCESITIDRKTGDDRFTFVKEPSVSICGGIQPGILARCLTDEHKENGLQSRLLMTFPPRQPKQWRDDELSIATQLAYDHCVRDLFELLGDDSSGESKPATLKLSKAARGLFKAYVNATGSEQSAMHGHLASQWSKLEEIPARLVIILHCVKQVTTGVAEYWTIDGPTMQAAINLAEWFKNETLRIGRTLGESEVIREARHLASWIQSNHEGRITARDLCKHRRDIVSTEEAELKLMQLVELELGTWRAIHKSREFVLNHQT
ncbi:MAG: DUF3987 domain-containing protein [Planctomyces sp.]|nr:DUF3987 domain-containing protein [Planctomyces sp.]